MILSSQARLYRKDGPALGMAGHVTRQRAASTKYVRRLARKNMPSDALRRPLTYPVRLTCVIYRAVPQSWSRRKRADAIADKIRPKTRPDVSNVIKGIEDALNGVWYKDDSQIVEYGVIGKWYAESPRVYVRLDVEVDDEER